MVIVRVSFRRASSSYSIGLSVQACVHKGDAQFPVHTPAPRGFHPLDMRTTSFYFQHDYNARNDERLLMLRAEHGAEAYGVFWMILESMAEANTSRINRVAIAGLSLGYGVAKERLSEIIDYCIDVGLFEESQEGAISSQRMKKHLAHRDALKVAGSEGAKKRWSTSQENRVANAKGKERKGNTTLSNERVSDHVIDEMENEFRQFVTFTSKVFGSSKAFTPDGLKKWKVRRKKFSARDLAVAIANITNEPDRWKLKNNGHRPLSWWLRSDEYIVELQNCHLKGGTKAVDFIS